MDLAPEFQQRLDFAKACWLQGLCTENEYLRAKRIIYQEQIEDIETGMGVQEWINRNYGEMAVNYD